MLTATLGRLIKDHRLRKRLSQLEISLRIGWRDTTRLSKIEQGRVGKPLRKTVDKIMEALDLNKQERGEFLLVGGYLPTDEEIKKVIKLVKERINTWPYPAYLLDFSWRVLCLNQHTIDIFKLPSALKSISFKKAPNLLEFLFSPKEVLPVKIEKGDDDKSVQPFPIAQVAQFKVEQNGRDNEKWYKDLIKKLMQNEQFRQVWPKVDPKQYHKKLLDYEYKVITWPDKSHKTFRFHIFTSRLIQDQRFQVVLYLTAE
ncbi:MAG: hypothetical protein UU73_C0003G0128 [Candidatus Daviesbacteria bacterium GW2011_GWA1_41_61]|uniref:HTH cro/C1-type domain-containing protein n=1 Tax=Candidatus Daviesbacteria bacterium GW2011_GWA2_40_9 TaxID=1618424 RepID=A0A0G0WFW8_9BACT|nr:MAG: hypothetical protein UU26_C0003G0098 [Candidatus Daviesbacteria bacterium GW2011_GWC1_40_9]KKR83175.1 MAG: hypothetical protein UU29_C0007G0045 [Candidatus Daviesbacteria bacterium GW2011_GWA2_40_9]KKR93522.1 MAG: hypothetical protein UU44_C0002G0183 [Candidatus Daviesbacteria bacterium GW2011_GWB1_41_15]KKS14929.1 MAG: hypothetical protein UU73_C0003G0128 [Candidatus Daviesbacteria bacterium GW2011_GWA1_41_61]